MLSKIKSMFSGKHPQEDVLDASKAQRENFKKLAEDNKDIVSGFEFCATMNPNVPLKILNRHCEFSEKIPDSDNNLTSAHGTWLPVISNSYIRETLSRGQSMASPIGQIPSDGGDLLPYLKAARRIIEAPLATPDNEISEALSRVDAIKQLRGGKTYERVEIDLQESADTVDYFSKVFQNDDSCLSLLLYEIGHGLGGLTIKNIRHLHAQGYNTVRSMMNAPDEVLLNTPGIGKAKLSKIREKGNA